MGKTGEILIKSVVSLLAPYQCKFLSSDKGTMVIELVNIRRSWVKDLEELSVLL